MRKKRGETMSEQTDNGIAAADDWLERALREDGGNHRADYLADDGFTARVAAALPPPATLPAWRKPAVAALWTAAAAGVAVALPGAVADVAAQVTRILGTHPISLANIATGVLALALASWVAAAYTLRDDS
jgi:hypothetical protein